MLADNAAGIGCVVNSTFLHGQPGDSTLGA